MVPCCHRAPLGLSNHDPAQVNTYRTSAGLNAVREQQHVVSRATPNIADAVAGMKVEEAVAALLDLAVEIGGAGRVQVAHEICRIGGPIHLIEFDT